jgi:hypothetical protein
VEKDEVGTSIQRLQGDSDAVSEVDCGWYGDHRYNKETITALLLKVERLEGNQNEIANVRYELSCTRNSISVRNATSSPDV